MIEIKSIIVIGRQSLEQRINLSIRNLPVGVQQLHFVEGTVDHLDMENVGILEGLRYLDESVQGIPMACSCNRISNRPKPLIPIEIK